MHEIDYDHIHKTLSSERFLKKQGHGNDLAFFICPYSPKDELQMKACIKKLEKNLPPIKFLHIDIYDLCIELLKGKEILQEVFKIESEKTKFDIKELFQSVFDSEKYLIPIIQERLKEDDQILLISGLGEVFPYIRSHNLLNNLQVAVKEQPILMFFPGEYKASEKEGMVLKLFNRLSDDKYYRASDIYDF